MLVICRFLLYIVLSCSTLKHRMLISMFLVLAHLVSQFDWEGDLPLKLPQKDLIIYEMHVCGFTKHESSKANFPGTYRGFVEKLDYLKVNSNSIIFKFLRVISDSMY